MAYTVVTGPASEPISLADAKTHLRVLHSDEDALISAYISAARAYVEDRTGLALLTQTVEEYFDALPAGRVLPLTVYPVQSVTSVEYLDATYQTWASTNYINDLVSCPCRIVRKEGIEWPSPDNEANAVKVTYVAGHASAAAVPTSIIQAMKLIIGFYYQNRDDMPLHEAGRVKVRAADALLHNHRTLTA